MRPGTPQFRRMWFCLRMLGLTVVFTFLFAIVVGIPFPGLWQAVFVPLIMVSAGSFLLLSLVFFTRGVWFRGKARHYGALLKVRTEAEFK